MSWRPAHIHMSREDYAENVEFFGGGFFRAWWLRNDIGFNVGRHSFHLLREPKVAR